ncbi:hypothetical protein RB598_006163 [Gaeumannomyces tritici]
MSTGSDSGSSSSSAGNSSPNSSAPASLCDEPIDTAKDDSLATPASDNADAKDAAGASSTRTEVLSSSKTGTSDQGPAVTVNTPIEGEAELAISEPASETCEKSSADTAAGASGDVDESSNLGPAPADAPNTVLDSKEGKAGLEDKAAEKAVEANEEKCESATDEINAEKTEKVVDEAKGEGEKSDGETRESTEEENRNEENKNEENKNEENKNEENKNEEPAKPPPMLPDWFLASNVLLFQDLPDVTPGIRFLKSDEDEEKAAPNKDENAKGKMDESGDVADYELEQDVYDEILDLVSPILQPPPPPAPKSAMEAWAKEAAVVLQSPRQGSFEFLGHMARRIARDLRADMVWLDHNDVPNLCVDLWNAEADGQRWNSEEMNLVETVFTHSNGEEVSAAAFKAILRSVQRKLAGVHVTDEKEVALSQTNEADAVPDATGKEGQAKTGRLADAEAENDAEVDNDAEVEKSKGTKPVPVRDETQGKDEEARGRAEETREKGEEASGDNINEAKAPTPEKRPLVILLEEASALPEEETFCRRLREAVVAQREKGQPILILATVISARKWSATGQYVRNVWEGLGVKWSTSFNVTPRHTKRASEALKQCEEQTKLVERWRWIRRAILCALLDAGQDAVAHTLFPSTLAQGEKHRLPDQLSADARQILVKWKNKEITTVVRQVCARARRAGAPPLEAKDVYAIMARTQRNIQSLKASRVADEPFEDEGGAGKKEKKKKSKVQELLDKIRGDCSDKEKELMSCVVDIDPTTAAADGIRIDPETMAGLDQMLSLRVRKSYGLLAKEGINGGVLFGPPGTGKTHLARVVAAKSGMNLIVATPADVQSCWVGETEALIQALFSLARRISPCVIFMDEAESLLARRGSGDREYTRKAMSQFLSEMDGLVQGDRKAQAPFLLIATNRPADLDDAVCRRLPHMLHVPMPRLPDRRAILDIYMRDEKVAADVNLQQLAVATDGFSGSDLRTLCVQAAMVAQRDAEEAAAAEGKKEGEQGKEKDGKMQEEEEPPRVIGNAHFRKALARTRPSVTQESLMTIERFIRGQKSTR